MVLIGTARNLLGMKTIGDEWYIIIKAVIEYYIACPCHPYNIECNYSMMISKTDVWFQSVYICSYFSCILWLQVTGGVMMFNSASNEPGTPVSPAQDHLYLVVGQTFQVEPFIFLQLDMVHVKKKKRR